VRHGTSVNLRHFGHRRSRFRWPRVRRNGETLRPRVRPADALDGGRAESAQPEPFGGRTAVHWVWVLDTIVFHAAYDHPPGALMRSVARLLLRVATGGVCWLALFALLFVGGGRRGRRIALTGALAVLLAHAAGVRAGGDVFGRDAAGPLGGSLLVSFRAGGTGLRSGAFSHPGQRSGPGRPLDGGRGDRLRMRVRGSQLSVGRRRRRCPRFALRGRCGLAAG
jgi:hypothetical protein